VTISRRRTLRLGFAAATTPLLSGGGLLAARAQPASPALTQAELDALDVLVAEQGARSSTFTYEDFQLDKDLRGEIVRTRVVPALRGTRLSATGEKLDRVAVADEVSPNYHHLRGLASSETFRLTADVLERMAAANSFSRAMKEGLGRNTAQSRIVIFGLRGCRLAPGATAAVFADEIPLVESDIDHRNKNCVMGVWDRMAKKVSAFTASTVPHLLYMQMYRINRHLLGDIVLDDATFSKVDTISQAQKDMRQLPWTANMLGQGLHMMQVGIHQGKYPNLLVQHEHWFGPVLRAVKRPGYTVDDWDTTNRRVGDNIHPCWPVPAWEMQFASAGCNLIEGESKISPDYDGPFSSFLAQIRKPADGLGGDQGDWNTYFYMLLSGREAHRHALSGAANAGLERLRFGSKGPAVAEFQKNALGYTGNAVDGVFGLGSHTRLLAWQRDRSLPSDGVVTPALLDLI
jgi:hypothetical protein